MTANLDKIPSGLSLSGLRALGAIYDAKQLMMNEVAIVIGFSRADATGCIDRLQERGLVARHHASGDRRSVFVRLTPEGEKLAGEIFR